MFARIAALLALAAVALTAAQAQPQRQTPYFASISSGDAMMRAGPGRTYPATWRYVRRDLPIRVVEIYQNWRKVEDPDGTRGWIMVSLLSDQRTAIVRGNEPQPMHEEPNSGSAIRFRAAPGVVGRISRCGDGWCHFDVRGRTGFIRTDMIWGVARNEAID